MLEPEIYGPQLDGFQERGRHQVEEQRQRDGDGATGEEGRDIGPLPPAVGELHRPYPPDPPIAGGFIGLGGASVFSGDCAFSSEDCAFSSGGCAFSSGGCAFLAGFVSVAAGRLTCGWPGSAFPNPGPVTQPGRESANTHSRIKATLCALSIAPSLSWRNKINITL